MTIILKRGIQLDDIIQKIEASSSQKKLNARKYIGVIKLDKDALKIQNELRNEWK